MTRLRTYEVEQGCVWMIGHGLDWQGSCLPDEMVGGLGDGQRLMVGCWGGRYAVTTRTQGGALACRPSRLSSAGLRQVFHLDSMLET